jgi:16S rRNA (cytosine1402-N4)-methyltransferase
MTDPDHPVSGVWDTGYHAPVLVHEIVRLLDGAATVLDCTLGGGGHSAALLDSGARVTGVDRDPEALAAAGDRLASYAASGRFRAHLANYARLDLVDALAGVRFAGILLDLGISSHQIDRAERGFTFREGAPLDMRMGDDASLSAADILNESDERELARVFREYADEPRAGRLAREVTRRRATAPFATSDDLVRAIRSALGPRTGPGDFARIFQGVRIAVNDELTGLAAALPALRDRLEPGGTLVVIAYHSGEDRLVKHAFREWSAGCVCPPEVMRCACRGEPLGETLTRKAVSAGEAETGHNPRARSARLRAWRSAR